MNPLAMDQVEILDTDVLVVGAGPTGLMAGLVLARRGIGAVVVDGKQGPTRESRAVAVQARTMEIYDQLGLAARVLEDSYPATRIQIGADARPGGVEVAETQRGQTTYPGIQIFEQSRNEALLGAELHAMDAAPRWGHRLVALLDEGPDGGPVVALVEGPGGLFRIRARWCIGADGASSPVRGFMGTPFEGVTDDATFYVADLRGVEGLPDHSLALRFGDATFALFFPLGPGGHARIISMAAGAEVDQEEALAAARADLGITYREVDWFSSYRVHHRVAARFRKGSLFLAGDAAHVHSPVGGQGMNTGLQDAHNLANLLADVALGHASTAALDRYGAERGPVAKNLVTVTDRVFSVVAGRGRVTALARRRLGGLMATVAPRLLTSRLGPWIGGLLGQYRIHYHYWPATAAPPAWGSDAAVGRRLPEAGGNLAELSALTWQLHTYGGSAERPDVPAWIEGPRDFGVDASRRLRPDRLYLVRPDGFVAAAFPLERGVADQGVVAEALAAHHLVV